MFIYYMDVESKDVSLANTTLANYQSHFAFFRFDGFHYSYIQILAKLPLSQKYTD